MKNAKAVVFTVGKAPWITWDTKHEIAAFIASDPVDIFGEDFVDWNKDNHIRTTRRMEFVRSHPLTGWPAGVFVAYVEEGQEARAQMAAAVLFDCQFEEIERRCE